MADDRRCDPELRHPGDSLGPCISNLYALCDRDQAGAPTRIAIAGAGIGGLTLALTLHEVGIEAEVFEQASKVRELGVGVNLQPHAIKVLAALGLLPALDRTGIRTRRMISMARRGQTVWDEPRGVEAGYDVPMFSIHRGKRQGVLYRAAVYRPGPNRIHTSHRLIGRREVGDGVMGRFERRADGEIVEVVGDALIGADGIHSALRAVFYPNDGPPSWNGLMLWRCALDWPIYADGRTIVIPGGLAAKLVYYPIFADSDRPEQRLMD
jgi:5-methylphenazine-1-carboxylate 1-monooxygenase